MRTSIISSVAAFTLCIGVGRAECQLFGGAETRNAAGDGLDLAAQVYGAYDDDVLAGTTGGAPLGQQTALLPQSGFYSGLAVGLTYGRSGDTSTFRSWVNSGVAYSPSQSDLTTMYHQAGLGFSTQLGRGIGLNAGSFADYSPRYSLRLIPVVSPMAPAVGSPLSEVPVVPAPDIEYTSIEREAYQYGGNIGLSIPVSSRIFMGVDYGQTQTTSQDELFDMRVRSAAASLGYRITKNASLTAGYYRYDARYTGADPRPTLTESVRVGVDYSKPLSITRRTTLQFSTGSAIAEDLDGQRSLQATGSAIVVHQMGRTWSARADYSRGYGYLEGFTEPVLSDSAGGGVSGLLSRRVEFSADAHYFTGTVGLTADAQPFDSYFAFVRVRTALTRGMAAYAEYFFNHYDLADVTLRSISLPRVTDRNGVRVGLSLWVPLVRGN